MDEPKLPRYKSYPVIEVRKDDLLHAFDCVNIEDAVQEADTIPDGDMCVLAQEMAEIYFDDELRFREWNDWVREAWTNIEENEFLSQKYAYFTGK
jgi:hypothetical protein